MNVVLEYCWYIGTYMYSRHKLVVYNNMKIGELLCMYNHYTKKYNKGKYIIMYIN